MLDDERACKVGTGWRGRTTREEIYLKRKLVESTEHDQSESTPLLVEREGVELWLCIWFFSGHCVQKYDAKTLQFVD